MIMVVQPAEFYNRKWAPTDGGHRDIRNDENTTIARIPELLGHVPRGFARLVGTAFQGSSGQGCLG